MAMGSILIIFIKVSAFSILKSALMPAECGINIILGFIPLQLSANTLHKSVDLVPYCFS
jgi:hypothetical protein